MVKEISTYSEIYMPLPVVVGKAVVQDRRQNSVCGLSFGGSCSTTIRSLIEQKLVVMKYL